MTDLSPASIWIFLKYKGLLESLEKNLKNYELAHSVDAIYHFLWDDFADWYVEYLKTNKTQLDFANDLFKDYYFYFEY